MIVREMTRDDIEEALDFWRTIPGMGLSGADEPERIEASLERNPGLSMLCEDDSRELVGTALCGTDMRRGYLYHVAVRGDLRSMGLGTAMVDMCLDRLRQVGVDKCTLLVFKDNAIGNGYWERSGWTRRDDIHTFSRVL